MKIRRKWGRYGAGPLLGPSYSVDDGDAGIPIAPPPQITGLVGLWWHGYGVTTSGGNVSTWAPVYRDEALYPVALSLSAAGSTNPIPWASGLAWSGLVSECAVTPGLASDTGGRGGWGLAHRTRRPGAGSIPFTDLSRPVQFTAGTGGGRSLSQWIIATSSGTFTWVENGAGPSKNEIAGGTYSQAGPTTEVWAWTAGFSGRYWSHRDPGSSGDNFGSGIVATCDLKADAIVRVGTNAATAEMNAGMVTDVVAVWIDSIGPNMSALADYIESLP